jgi:hypothetical protein
MAIKTFSDGNSLPASDINTYLTNSGLVYVTEANPSAVSSVSIDNCFSATYNAYRIVWVPTAYSSTGQVQTGMRLRVSGVDNSNNNYYRARWYYGAGGASGTDGGTVAGSYWDWADTNTPLQPMSLDVYSPFQVNRTSAGCKAVSFQLGTTLFGIESVGITTVTTSYDGFSWLVTGGTFTGKLLVYGYRQA